MKIRSSAVRQLVRLGLVPLLGIFVALTQPAAAKEASQIVIQTYSVVSSFKPPPWSADPDVAKHSEVLRDETKTDWGTRFFVWEMLPKGENLNNWTKRYGINAEYPAAYSLEEYLDLQANLYGEDCTDAHFRYIDGVVGAGHWFMIYCESYKNQPDTGEVAFFHSTLQRKTIVRHYYKIRLPKYDFEVVEDSPISEEETNRLIRHVIALDIAPLAQE